ncbi:MAG: UvrB/UvrC motif-containing protein [Clostridia bacterium]|nr:UvrB/UvrC motif-containing protein [Clostridia bacterium]
MKCDKCGNESVYHSKLIVNGVSQTTNLCRECAIKEGVFATEPTSIFDDMFNIFSDFLPYERVEDIVCPVCKTSLREYRNTRLLGCMNCYESFKDEIKSIIDKIAPYPEHKQEAIEVKHKTRAKQSKQDKIAKLREDMASAVQEERYEDAAKIKKQIAKLEAENE